jgi:hypothetical protein
VHVVAVAAEDPVLSAVVAQVPWMGVDLRRVDPRPGGLAARLLLAARSVLSLLLYRPGRRSRRLAMPLLVCIADADMMTSTRLAGRAAATAPRGELRRYPGGHLDAYVGGVFEAMVSDQIAFLLDHVAGAGDG